MVVLIAIPAGAAGSVEPRQLRGHTGAVTCAAFSANGQRLVSGSLDGTVRLWNVSTGKEIRQIPGQLGCVWDVAFLPDDHRVVCAGDKGLGTWDTRSGKSVSRFAAASGPVKAIAVTRDGRYAVACGGKTVRVWHIVDAQPLREFEHVKTVVAVAVSSDGRYAVSAGADAVIRLWDIPANKEIGHKQAPGFASYDGLSLSSDDRTCAFAGRTVAAAGLWDIRTRRAYWLGKKPSSTTFAPGIARVVFSPDGRHILTVGTDDGIRVWDAKVREEIHQFPGRAGGIDVICFSPLGDLVLSAGQDAVIRLWPMSKEFAGICPSREASSTPGAMSAGAKVVSAVRPKPTTPLPSPVAPVGAAAPGSAEAAEAVMAALRVAARKPISPADVRALIAAMSEMNTAIPAARLISGGTLPTSVDALVKRLDQMVEVKAILGKHGLRTRDFVEKTFIVVFAVMAIDNGGVAGMEAAVAQMASGPLANAQQVQALRKLVGLCKLIPASTYNAVRAMRAEIVQAFNS